MTRETGKSDQFKVQNATPAEVSVGWAQKVSWKIDYKTEAGGGVGQGATLQYHDDGVTERTLSLDTKAVDFKSLQLMGAYSAGWTIAFGNTLPVHSVIANTSAGKIITFTGVKWDHANIQIVENQPLKITYDGKALSHTFAAGSTSYTKPSTEPIPYTSLKCKWDGDYIGAVRSGSIDYDREATFERGAENQSDTNPSEICEGMHLVTFDLTIDVTDTFMEKIDTREDKTLILETTTTGGTLTVTGCRIYTEDADKDADGKPRSIKITGQGFTPSVAGS